MLGFGWRACSADVDRVPARQGDWAAPLLPCCSGNGRRADQLPEDALMDATDPDYAAFVDRLPVLRRYEEVIRTRLHHWAIRDPERPGSSLGYISV